MSLLKVRQLDAGPNVGQVVHMEDLGAGRLGIQFALSDSVFIEISAIDNGDGSYDMRITPPGGGDGLTISADTGGNISYSLTSAIQSTLQSLVSILIDAPTLALSGNLNFNTPGGTIENLIAIGHEKNSVSTPLVADDLPITADINILTLTQDQAIDSFINEPTLNDRDFILIVKQDATGGHSITSWPASVIWPGHINEPVIPQGINEFMEINFIYDGINHYGNPVSQEDFSTRFTKNVTVFDDFLNDVINPSKWTTAVGSDPQCSISGAQNTTKGRLRLLTGDNASGTMSANGVQIFGGISVFRPPEIKKLIFETSVILETLTEVVFFAGITDSISLEMPFEIGSSDVITSNAQNAVGFIFDTNADTDNIWLVGVEADVNANAQDTGQTYALATFKKLRLEIDSNGDTEFFINDVKIGTTMTNSISPTNGPFVPTIAAFSRDNSQKFTFADYILVYQER